VGADYPKKMRPPSGAPAVLARQCIGSHKSGDGARVARLRKPMLRVSASEKKHAPLYWVWRLKVFGQVAVKGRFFCFETCKQPRADISVVGQLGEAFVAAAN
jgi:hypothetical protein